MSSVYRIGWRRLTRPETARTWWVIGLTLVMAMAATGLLLVDPEDPPGLLLLLGRFHPMVVHFPIGLLLLAALLEGAALIRPLRAARHAAPLVLFLGAVSAAAAALVGHLLSLEGGYDAELIDSHRWMGVTVAFGAALATALRLRRLRRRGGWMDRAYGGVLAATVGALLLTGHLGGSLTHGSGYLTYYLPDPVKRLAGMEAHAAEPKIADIDSAVVYRDLIAPVFEARCVSCHGAAKEKGGLRLDTPEGLLEGGESGAVLVAGLPEESELLRRLILPPGHEDAMPPDGAEPLGIGETEVIRWWIQNGASMEQKVADVEEVPSAVETWFARVAPPRSEQKRGLYAIDVPPADAKALAGLRAMGYGIRTISHDLELLQVSGINLRNGLGDAELARLAPVAEQVGWLDLSHTAVGDEGLAVVARMPNLTRLRLDGTGIGDAGLRHLRGLARLEYLNLVGTRVGDEGLAHLEGLGRLRTLYLWRTDVTEEAVARLRERLPELEVVLGVEPAVEET